MLSDVFFVKNRALAFLLVCASTLYFGLNLKGGSLKNTLVKSDLGLVFDEGSFASASIELDEDSWINFNEKGFLINLSFNNLSFEVERGEILARVVSGNGDSLNLFFWDGALIVTLSDDFDNSKNAPRVRVKLDKKQNIVSVAKLKGQMMLYLDGDLADSVIVKGEDELSFSKEITLIFGGNYSFNESWNGVLYSASMGVLGGDMKAFVPFLDYSFNDAVTGVKDKSVFKNDLEIDALNLKGKSIFLRGSSLSNLFRAVDLVDAVLNFIWFFLGGGLLFVSSVSKVGRKYFLKGFCYAFLVCFFLSFTIEYIQSWLPMRDSSWRDLILNSLGGLFGIVASLIVIRFRGRAVKIE